MARGRKKKVDLSYEEQLIQIEEKITKCSEEIKSLKAAKNFEIINKMKLDDMEVCFYRKNKEIYSSEKEQFYIKCNEITNE